MFLKSCRRTHLSPSRLSPISMPSVALKLLSLIFLVSPQIFMATYGQSGEVPEKSDLTLDDDAKANSLDLNHVLVIQEELSKLNGGDNDVFQRTQFGFSLALVPVNQSGDITGWIYIGAPNSTIFRTSPPRSSGQGLLPPGLVWRCRLGNFPKNSPHDEKLCEAFDLSSNECQSKTHCGDRVGSTLSTSNRQNLVICAPNWNYEVNDRNAILKNGHRMEGHCFFLSQDQATSENLVQNLKDSTLKLEPFSIDAFKAIKGDFTFQNNSNLVRWYWGQSGFASHMTDSQSILLGAPGVLQWNGSVIAYRRAENNPASPYTSSDMSILLPSLYNGHPTKAKEDLNLFGYALSSGKYGCSATTYAVSGSPRGADLHGVVLIKKLDAFIKVPTNLETNPSRVRTSQNNFTHRNCIWKSHSKNDIFDCSEQMSQNAWKGDVRLESEDFGSYFGSVLKSIDINGDGIEELFVGAPFHAGSDVNNENDNGCVFIYNLTNAGNCGTLNSSPVPLKKCGDFPGGRFGSSIASLKDINIDGYNDVIIGAPYEENGTVYIYFGGPKGVSSWNSPGGADLKFQAGQKYLEHLSGFSGFGQTVTGGVDIDGNGTPDFAVGDFSSGKVAVFRTRPKLRIETSTQIFTNNGNDQVAELPTNATEFTYRICARIFVITTTLPNGQRETFLNRPVTLPIGLRIRIEENRFNWTAVDGVAVRVPGSSTTFVRNVTTGQDTCVDMRAQRKPLDPDESDEENPLGIRRELWNNLPMGQGPFLTTYTIKHGNTNQGNDRPSFERSGDDFDRFCSWCPMPGGNYAEIEQIEIQSACKIAGENCRSDLHIDFKLEGFGTDQIKSLSVLKNFGQTAENSILDLGYIRWLKVTATVTNSAKGFASKSPMVIFKLSDATSSKLANNRDALTLIAPNFDRWGWIPRREFRLENEGKEVHFNITEQNRLLGRNRMTQQIFWIDLKKVRAVERFGSKLLVQGNVSDARGSSVETPPFTLNYNVTAGLTFEGTEKDGTLREAGSAVTESFQFIVALNGHTEVGALSLDVFLPRIFYRINSQPQDEFVFKISVQDTRQMTCREVLTTRSRSTLIIDTRSALFTSPLSPLVSMVRKPESAPAGSKVTKTAGAENEIIEIDCNHPDISSQHCAHYRCVRVRDSFEKTFTLTFNLEPSRNVSKPLLDFMSDKKILRLRAKGVAQIFDGEGKDDRVERNLTINLRKPSEKKPEQWTFIASAIGGFLILILIIIALCLCGFFKRGTKAKLEELKAQAEAEDAQAMINTRYEDQSQVVSAGEAEHLTQTVPS